MDNTKITSQLKYIPNYQSIPNLVVNPSILHLKEKVSNNIIDTLIKLTAVNQDILVKEIILKNGVDIISFKSNTFPIYIPKNSTAEVKISTKYIDTNSFYSSFEIITDKCSIYFSCNGGKSLQLKSKTLNVVKPKINDILVAGQESEIIWEGVAKSDSVSIDFSSNSGKDWVNIADKVADNKYIWKNVPNIKSNNCLIRITQNDNLSDTYNKPLHTLFGHNAEVYNLAFSIDGNILATAGRYGIIKLWDVNTGYLIKTLLGHKSDVKALDFSPDGKYLASCGNDGLAIIWDYKSDSILKTFFHDNTLFSVKFNHKVNQLAVAGMSSIVFIWDVITDELVRNTGYIHNSTIFDIKFTNDDNYILTASLDKYAILYNIQNRNIKKYYSDYAFRKIEYFPNGKNFISSDVYNGRIKYWDIDSNKELRLFNTMNEHIQDISLNYDATKLISVVEYINLWNVDNGVNIRKFKGHKNVILGAQFSPNGELFATCSLDSSAKIWRTELNAIQSDSSDYFSIIAPDFNLKKQYINMGNVVLGNSKDTLINQVFCNESNAPLHILGVNVTFWDSLAFSVPRGAGEFTLEPGDCRDIMFSFLPKNLGFTKAKITVNSTIGAFKDTIIISGYGVPPSLFLNNKLIDFGTIEVNSKKTIQQIPIITNITKSKIKINNLKIISPNDEYFTLLSQISEFELNPNDTLKIDLEFSPKYEGRSSGRLLVQYESEGSPDFIDLIGNSTEIGNSVEPIYKPLIEIKSIQPNPASDFIEIYYDFNSLEKAELRITNILGQVVYSQTLAKASNGYLKIDARNFGTGQYFATFTSENIMQNYIIGVVR